MSKTKEQQPAYISRVHLKGYKSIRDLEIDFKAGLNIIIGPNGSGKTNFLEFLSDTYTGIGDNTNIIGNEVDFNLEAKVKEGTFIHKIKGEYELGEKEEGFVFRVREILIENEITLSDIEYKCTNENSKLFPDHIYPTSPNQVGRDRFSYIHEVSSIKYNNIFNSFLLKPLLFKFRRKGNKIFSLMGFMGYNSGPASMPFFTHIQSKGFVEIKKDKIPKLITNLNISQHLIDQLAIYTPIKSLKFEENSSRQVEENGEFIIDGVQLSFNVNDNWWYWSQLSDGTKRMFYIFCNVIHWNTTFVFIEEPELGIHPDQLHLLMDFLKEQSQKKQIIITTHSPEVLNILEKEELDRIIVTRYDAEKGTQMHHLSPNKIKKGQMYMDKVGYLSNFWVHSNLEEYEAEEYEVE